MEETHFNTGSQLFSQPFCHASSPMLSPNKTNPMVVKTECRQTYRSDAKTRFVAYIGIEHLRLAANTNKLQSRISKLNHGLNIKSRCRIPSLGGHGGYFLDPPTVTLDA